MNDSILSRCYMQLRNVGFFLLIYYLISPSYTIVHKSALTFTTERSTCCDFYSLYSKTPCAAVTVSVFLYPTPTHTERARNRPNILNSGLSQLITSAVFTVKCTYLLHFMFVHIAFLQSGSININH